MKIALVTANLAKIDSDKFATYPNQKISPENSLSIFSYDDENFLPRKNAMHPRLQAKIPKMLAFEERPGYDYYIWLDASLLIKSENFVQWLVDECKDEVAVFFKHPFRNSISEELEFMDYHMNSNNQYLIDRYQNEPIHHQVKTYLEDNAFTDQFLIAAGAFIYTPKFALTGVLNNWFYQCARFSVQDQFSLPYVLQKSNLQPKLLEENILDNRYIASTAHLY
jgi:hypothetical protein